MLNLDGRRKNCYTCCMTTITIPAINLDQETAIILFLDALHVPYKMTGDIEETDYLRSFPANAEHLNKSMEQGKNGQITQISLDDIC